MRIIKSPEKIHTKKGEMLLFLAGSIEMGTAENWQQKVEKELDKTAWTILNPRRNDWKINWVQSIKNKKFKEQVEWELGAMELADLIFVYFSPATKSPITLLEVGLNAQKNKLIVCCPNGYWRKGNIEIVCKKYKIPLLENLADGIELLKKYSNAKK